MFFGDGVEVKLTKAFKFPGIIGCVIGVKTYIEADIVKNDLTLPRIYENCLSSLGL